MLKLSDEALGAIMLALQKSLMSQSDIVPILKGFNFKVSEIFIYVKIAINVLLLTTVWKKQKTLVLPAIPNIY